VGDSLTVETPFTVADAGGGFYRFSASPSWAGASFSYWGAGEQSLGDDPEESDWIWADDGAFWAPQDPDSMFYEQGAKVDQVSASYRLDVP
jgi:hypothetical protein